VIISEETDYPFKGSVKLSINAAKPSRFPIYLRIPGWADSVIVKFKNNTAIIKGETEYRLNERWKNDDQITIEIPLKMRTEKRFNNSVSLLRGPLVFSLRIDKKFKSIKNNYDNFSYKGSIDWEIDPASPWNYGLLIDKQNIMRGLKFSEYPVGRYPFADKGDMIWSADSGRYDVWTSDAPLLLTARGIKIPEWTIRNNSADLPPVSPVKPEGDPEIITLVPYGCARLRITEFPVMDIMLMEDVIKPGKE
jgi:hypothetical protein